jgi:hypothetical protein
VLIPGAGPYITDQAGKFYNTLVLFLENETPTENQTQIAFLCPRHVLLKKIIL